MSLQALVLSLVSGIDDPKVRMDICSTIYFLRDLYLEGKITEGQLRKDLMDIVTTIISAKHPELLPDEVKKKAERVVADIIRSYKLSTLRVSVIKRYSTQLSYGLE